MKTTISILIMFCLVGVLSVSPLWAADAPATSAPSEGEAPEKSLTEVNKQLTNPVSDLWSIAFQQNNYRVDTGEGTYWNSNLNFQPVMPVALTEEWNLITRPVIPLFISQPHPDPQNPDEIERTTGFGDIVLMEMVSPSPKLAGKWLFGLGPTFIFPTASTDWTGQGKWQVGPAAIAGYLSEKWILGAFAQQWWSFAGSDSRPDTSQMNLQPIAAYFLHEGWSIGYSGNVLANWEVDGGNVWTVPLGIAVSKVVKLGRLPVKLALAGQYMPIHPDEFGQEWNIQLQFVPVIPKLIKGTLFGE